jgi:hypothetical protein
VSEKMIRSLAGHISKKMLKRYSHTRFALKPAAIAALETQIIRIDSIASADFSRNSQPN